MQYCLTCQKHEKMKIEQVNHHHLQSMESIEISTPIGDVKSNEPGIYSLLMLAVVAIVFMTFILKRKPKRNV